MIHSIKNKRFINFLLIGLVVALFILTLAFAANPIGKKALAIGEPQPTGLENDVIQISAQNSSSSSKAVAGIKLWANGSDSSTLPVILSESRTVLFEARTTDLSPDYLLYLYQGDAVIGQMADDGRNGDRQAGDGIYSYSYTYEGGPGAQTYTVHTVNATSNAVTVDYSLIGRVFSIQLWANNETESTIVDLQMNWTVLFEARASDVSLGSLSLYQGDTLIGQMTDDGRNGDMSASDGTYSYSYTYRGSPGTLAYTVSADGVVSNVVRVTYAYPSASVTDLTLTANVNSVMVGSQTPVVFSLTSKTPLDGATPVTLYSNGQVVGEMTDDGGVYTYAFQNLVTFAGTYSFEARCGAATSNTVMVNYYYPYIPSPPVTPNPSTPTPDPERYIYNLELSETPLSYFTWITGLGGPQYFSLGLSVNEGYDISMGPDTLFEALNFTITGQSEPAEVMDYSDGLAFERLENVSVSENGLISTGPQTLAQMLGIEPKATESISYNDLNFIAFYGADSQESMGRTYYVWNIGITEDGEAYLIFDPLPILIRQDISSLLFSYAEFTVSASVGEDYIQDPSEGNIGASASVRFDRSDIQQIIMTISTENGPEPVNGVYFLDIDGEGNPETAQLGYQLKPETAEPVAVLWRLNGTPGIADSVADYATIDSNGLVTPLKPTPPGEVLTATVSVRGIPSSLLFSRYSFVITQCGTTVGITGLKNSMDTVRVPPERFNESEQTYSLTRILPLGLVDTTPAGTFSDNVNYYTVTSSNPDLPVINQEVNGVETPVISAPSPDYEGETMVTVTLDAPDMAAPASANFTLIIDKDAEEATAFSVPETMEFVYGETGAQRISPKFEPADSAPGGDYFVSSDSGVAVVDDYGNVTPTGLGEATITTTVYGRDASGITFETKKTTRVIVSQKDPIIAATPGSLNLTVGETQTLSVYYGPGVTQIWTAFVGSHIGIEVIDSDTLGVTGTEPGGGILFLFQLNTNTVIRIPVTITEAQSEDSITISPDLVSAAVGENQTVTATVVSSSSDQVVWTIADPSVATVVPSEDGLSAQVKGVAEGETVLTAALGEMGVSASVPVVITAAPEIAPTGITLSTDQLYLTTLASGIKSAELRATPAPADTTYPIIWASSAPGVAAVAGDGTVATVTAVAVGEATITAQVGDYTAQATVTVSDDVIVADRVIVTSYSPDYFTVTAKNVRANPALNSGSSNVVSVEMFCWSEANQGDINAKKAQSGEDDWSFTFPVNDNGVNNYFYDADDIHINVYASTQPGSNGVLINAQDYTWMSGVPGGDASGYTVAYITYSQDNGFNKPTVYSGLSGTMNEHKQLEGLRVSSNVGGVSISTSVHVENVGWMDPVSDGTYAGTMGQNLQIEAVRLNLEGPLADNYRIRYRAYCEDIGWTDWVGADEVAGTVGQGLQMEGVEIELLPR